MEGRTDGEPNLCPSAGDGAAPHRKLWARRDPSLGAGARPLTAPSATGTAARGVNTMLLRSLLAYSGQTQSHNQRPCSLCSDV